MEVLGIASSIIAVVQLTASCIKLTQKFLGPSQHNSESLGAIQQALYSFNGTIKNLQTHLEINEEDHTRLEALNHLDEPIKRCDCALKMLQDRLENVNFLGQYLVGNRFDGRLRKCLKTIAEARRLFELALAADQK
jgi:hypothetical protein